MTETRPLYLDDTYLFECSAQVISVSAANENEFIVLLDQTVFHPQGGGQPADFGTITSPNGLLFSVSNVLKKDGLIEHYGRFHDLSKTFSIGDNVVAKIDGERRILLARIHCAGHLFDWALCAMGMEGEWTNGSSKHYPDSMYIEKILPPDTPPATIKDILDRTLSKAREMIAADLRHRTFFIPPQEVPPKCTKFFNEQMWRMPLVRMTQVESPEMEGWMKPCGGTHPSSLGCIGDLRIEKYSFKKGLLRISYSIGQDTLKK